VAADPLTKGPPVPVSRARVPARLTALALAAALLALGGCKVNVDAGDHGKHHDAKHATKQHHGKKKHPAKKHHGAKHHKAAAAGTDTLVTEPGAGFGTVYRLIDHARHRIDLTMYELSDTTAEHDLAAAAQRGVDVRVVLDQRERDSNEHAYDYLRDHRVHVVWSWTHYDYTHQKTLVADQTAVIMTANLTSQYYATSRDFLVVDTNSADVAAIARVFAADFAHHAITPGHGRDLVWSPGSSSALLGVINGARHSLRIYSEEMGDSTVVSALVAAVKRGVDVQVCGENSDGEYDSEFKTLAKAGAHVSYYDSPSGFYIHGKVIEADYGTARARIFIGSENFSDTSLDRNRELGLIITSHAVMASIAATFARDFRRGHHESA
jgi:cardiolipin synthase A/B